MAFGDDDDLLRRIEEEQRAREALKVFYQKTLRFIVGADVVQKNRFSHWSITGYAYTETDHIEVSVLNSLDVNDNPHRRKAWSGPGVVWVGLDPDGNVLFQDWPEHYKEPIRTSSTKLIGLDLSDRLEIFEKCHRLHDTARCFQLAEEAGHITRHEAQLIVDFDACYIEGLHLLENKKMLPGANQWPDPSQQQLQGKEIFAELQKCYGDRRFPCIETVVIAAKYLDNMWDDANSEGWWMLSDSKFLDIFLLRMHKFLWRTHGPAKHRQTIYNLPLASHAGVFVEDGLQYVFERDRDANHLGRNVVRTRDRLKALAAASPIAAAACRAEIRRPKGLARDGTDESFTPILKPAQESSISLLQFRQWLEIFYQNSEKPRTLPTEVEPLAIREIAGYEFETAALLETIADSLAPYTHYTLVQMVWRDFLMPAAVEGDVQELINHGGHLMLMIQGEEPLVHSYYTLKALINHRDPLDEENYPSDVELYDAAYNNIDAQGPGWYEQW
ncbi:hypothetical protein CKM354_000216900 [Cercospora kikuchii]|uniref:Uncharacterized protein n=1 Tax=Cercospora kikuchii TaxID=84275 RepID=A0A9P3CE70_9PEZI|nr:uncharacterized protein CKM354_000216900 [Cercospora kikuchii]GIZ38765.1 hypothetical protein CKM354_000216900 [Cercospora kikuchii]